MKVSGNVKTSSKPNSSFLSTLKSFCLIFLTTLLLTSCGDKKPEANQVIPEGMIEFPLNKYGKPFSIVVPDTLKQKFTVVEQASGSLDIAIGNNFAISINEQPADIELKKKDIKEDDVNKFKSFVLEEPNAIIWESEITAPEFHFLLNHKIGNTEYSFEEIKNPDANSFGKEAIQRMFDRCKAATETPKDKKS